MQPYELNIVESEMDRADRATAGKRTPVKSIVTGVASLGARYITAKTKQEITGEQAAIILAIALIKDKDGTLAKIINRHVQNNGYDV